MTLGVKGTLSLPMSIFTLFELSCDRCTFGAFSLSAAWRSLLPNRSVARIYGFTYVVVEMCVGVRTYVLSEVMLLCVSFVLELARELMLCLVKLHGTVVVPFVRYLPFIVLISIFYIFISAELLFS